MNKQDTRMTANPSSAPRRALSRLQFCRSLTLSGLMLTGLMAAPGCGGGGSGTAITPSGGTGRATFTVHWPEPSRLIPSASNSIVVKLTKTDGTAIAGQRVDRPAGGGTSTMTFENVPAGEVIVRALALALPNPNGTGTTQAYATASVTIEGGKTTALSLTLDSTIDRLAVSPSPLALTVGQTTALVVTAKNLANDIVLTDPAKITFKFTNSSLFTAFPATVDSTGTVKGFLPGTMDIVVTEAESGKTATVSVTVTPVVPAALAQKSVSFQIDAGHSGHAVFGQPLRFPDQPAWSIPLTAEHSPIIADGRVIVFGSMTQGSGIFAFDRNTGARLWGPVGNSADGRQTVVGVAYDSGIIVATIGTTSLFLPTSLLGIDPQTGTILWQYRVPNYAYTPSPPAAGSGVAVFSIVDYSNTTNIRYYAVDCRTGTLRWEYALLNDKDISDRNQTIATDSGLVFFSRFGGGSGKMEAFNLSTGTLVWKEVLNQSLTTPAYFRGKIYTQSKPQPQPAVPTDCLVVNANTGGMEGTYVSYGWTPAFLDTAALFASSTGLIARDLASQQTLWAAPTFQTPFPPIIIDKTVFALRSDGNVVALEGGTGQELWHGMTVGKTPSTTSLSRRFTSGLAAGEGWLIAPAEHDLTAWNLAGAK